MVAEFSGQEILQTSNKDNEVLTAAGSASLKMEQNGE